MASLAQTLGNRRGSTQTWGGNLWTPMTFDEEKNLLYVPGGNAAPDIYDEGSSGHQPVYERAHCFGCIDWTLGVVPQFIPHDVHDYDVTHVGPISKRQSMGRRATCRQHRKRRNAAADRPRFKDILYSVPFTNDRTLKLLLTTTPNARLPGDSRGQEWNGSAYHVKLNLLVVPATDWCAEFKKDATPPSPEKEHTHGFYFGSETKFIRGQPHVDGSLGSTR